MDREENWKFDFCLKIVYNHIKKVIKYLQIG